MRRVSLEKKIKLENEKILDKMKDIDKDINKNQH